MTDMERSGIEVHGFRKAKGLGFIEILIPGGTMKKIIIFITLILILSIAVFRIQSSELFIKIKSITPFKEVSLRTKQISGLGENKYSVNGKTVRVVILNSDSISPYHQTIELQSELLNIYYGKKYENKKAVKKIRIDANSNYFSKKNCVKVEGTKIIKWLNASQNHGNHYRGEFYIYKTSKGLIMVNEVKMNDYVASVVSSEIGNESPMEALKAQSVCARTYIAQLKQNKYKKYHAIADDSVAFQVYNKTEPDKKCREAAKTTGNEIMTYDNKPIQASYFSTSCGYTTDGKIWNDKKLKYLSGCSLLKEQVSIKTEQEFENFIKTTPKAYESKYPFYRWKVYLTLEQIENGIYKTVGEDPGRIKKIEVNERGTGGIVSQIAIYGSNCQVVMTNQNQIRKALISPYSEIKLNDGSVRSGMELLPSAFIWLQAVSKNGVVTGYEIYGGGFGHGSGMSQNGAIELAKDKKTYREILEYFYKDIDIVD